MANIDRAPLAANGAARIDLEDKAKARKFRALRDRIALRRSFSTKHASVSSPTLLSPSSEVPPSDTEEEKAVPLASPTRAKSNAFGRLITGKLGRKGAKTGQDVDAAPIPVALDAAPTNSSTPTPPNGECLLSIPEVDVPPTTAAPMHEVAAEDTQNVDPEPLPLARKIHSLLSSLPPFLPTFEDPASDGSNGKDGDTAPATDVPSPIPNSRLISLLSSPSMMNGSLAQGRQSVWTLLDNLRLTALRPNADTSTGTSQDAAGGTQGVGFVEDDDSIMLYGPLIPDEGSSVELARSEIVSVDENGTIVNVVIDDAPPPGSGSVSRPIPPTGNVKAAGFHWHWPFHRDAPPSPPKMIEKRVWVPSTTKLSLQVMWWGYRLWLPPSVLAMLNDKEIEAAKLGAMLTTALTWILNNVPDTVLPASLRPALQLIKSLVPYLGYIGGFVAWSWSAIKGFDIGNGVTLTATWLLPIALIPATWENADVPKPADPSTFPTPASSTPSTGTTNPTTPGTSDPSTPSSDPSTTPSAHPTPANPSSPTTSTPTDPTSPTSPTLANPTSPTPTEPAVESSSLLVSHLSPI